MHMVPSAAPLEAHIKKTGGFYNSVCMQDIKPLLELVYAHINRFVDLLKTVTHTYADAKACDAGFTNLTNYLATD